MTRKKNEYEKAVEWLKERIGNRGQAAAAEKMGASTSTLNRVLNGGNPPSADKMLNWLSAYGAYISYPDERAADYSFIPKVEAVAGAGESLETSDAINNLYAFRTDFLSRMNISATKSVLFQVRGDSMEPTIRDGDTILVDQTDALPQDGFIYLSTLGDALMVKRFQRIPGGWRLRSENPDRGYIDVQGGDQLSMLRVHGRVKWIGRVL